MRFLFLFLVIGLAFVSVTGSGSKALAGDRPIVTKITKAQSRQLLEYLQREDDTGSGPAIAFKVAGIIKRNHNVCSFQVGRVTCVNHQVVSCPKEIEVEYPTGTRESKAVDCIGPDDDGNCECEFS